MRRKSPKTHQEPPGSWTSGEGGLAPFDPPALYPSGIVRNNLNPQASSMAPTPPCHGLKVESVPLMKPKKKQDRFAHKTKVANRSFVVSETLSRGCGSPQGERERKVKHFSLGPPRGFQRAQPLARLSSPLRVWELCSHIGECRGAAPLAIAHTARRAAQRSKTP